MSETKKERTLQDITQDYNNLAFRAGNLQYEIACKEADLTLLNDSMKDLNFEFAKVKNATEAADLAKKTPVQAVPAPVTAEVPANG